MRCVEKEKLNEYFGKLLESSDYPVHKREKARLMFRRLIGRSALSRWEFYILMGVLSRSIKSITGRRR